MKKRVWISPSLVVCYLCMTFVCGKDAVVKPYVYHGKTESSGSFVSGGTEAAGHKASVKTIAKSAPGWKEIMTEGTAGSDSSESESSENNTKQEDMTKLLDDTEKLHTFDTAAVPSPASFSSGHQSSSVSSGRKTVHSNKRFSSRTRSSGLGGRSALNFKSPEQVRKGTGNSNIPGSTGKGSPSSVGYFGSSLLPKGNTGSSSSDDTFPSGVFSRQATPSGNTLQTGNMSNSLDTQSASGDSPFGTASEIGGATAATSAGMASAHNLRTVVSGSGSSASLNAGAGASANAGGSAGASTTRGGAAAAASGVGAAAASSSSKVKKQSAKSDSLVKAGQSAAASSASGKKVKTNTGIRIVSAEVTTTKAPKQTTRKIANSSVSDSDSDESDSEDEIRSRNKRMKRIEKKRLRKLVQSRKNTRRERIDKSLNADRRLSTVTTTTKKPQPPVAKMLPQSWKFF